MCDERCRAAEATKFALSSIASGSANVAYAVLTLLLKRTQARSFVNKGMPNFPTDVWSYVTTFLSVRDAARLAGADRLITMVSWMSDGPDA